ncbi:MAG TPA: hypothetical protein VG713_16795 [Pirellulales bacterium]|nr:hypothetical protein [Pirellulales bacterium]
MSEQQLLGYLMGALDACEQRALEERLRREPELCRQLERLRACLAPLSDDEPPPPPTGLAARAFSYVMARVGPCEGQFAACNAWRPQDIVVASFIVITLAMLVFPAVSFSRYRAQVRACQHNLANIGHALLTYSQRQGDYFPEVPLSGNLAAAGIYAPTLAQAKLIEPRQVLCPAMPATQGEHRIPTLDELRSASGPALRNLQQQMGGSYGYSFGYWHNGQYQKLRNRARPTFALMADAPSGAHVLHEGRTSANHGRCGQNVLFEDGHVALLQTCRIKELGDHIFQNNLGHVAAGIGPEDSVIAPSDTAPVPLDLLPVTLETATLSAR